MIKGVKNKWYFCRMWNLIRKTSPQHLKLINTDCGHPCCLTEKDHKIFREYDKRRKSGKDTYYSFKNPDDFITHLDGKTIEEFKKTHLVKESKDKYGNKIITVGLKK